MKNPYGRSKRIGEEICLDLDQNYHNKTYIIRLPGIFGKECKPNYNSVVATFCHNVINKIELKIHYPNKEIELIFIEDLCEQLSHLISHKTYQTFIEPKNVYKIKLLKLASMIENFQNSFDKIQFLKSINPLELKLYKTFISCKIKT